jgi:hypothetical protein
MIKALWMRGLFENDLDYFVLLKDPLKSLRFSEVMPITYTCHCARQGGLGIRFPPSEGEVRGI